MSAPLESEKKPNVLKSTLQFTISLIVAVGLMWFVYRDQSIDEIIGQLASADYFWVGISFLPMFISHFIRAYRWNILLAPLGYKPKLHITFLALLTSYFTNSIIPRLGEITRCTILRRTDKIPLTTSVGTVFTDRLLDLVVLAFITLLAFIFEFDKMRQGLIPLFSDKLGNEHAGLNLIILIVATLTVGVFIIWGMLKYKEWLKQFKLIRKAVGFGRSMLEGLLSITKLPNVWEFVLHTILIWVGYLLTVYFLFLSFGPMEQLDIKAALLVLVFGSFAMVAPTQNGIGPYHFMVASALMIYGLSDLDAKAGTLILHTSQMVASIVFGGLAGLIVIMLPEYRRKSAVNRPDNTEG